MFWRNKFTYKQPKNGAALNYRLQLLTDLLGDTSDTNVYGRSFTRAFGATVTKDQAITLFEEVKQHIGLGKINIQLDFFWEKPLETKENTGFIDTSELYQMERLKIGEYLENKEGFTIKLGMTTLKNTNALVFTMAHELAHYQLLAEHQLFYNDEKLTDILAIRGGFAAYWLYSQNWEDTANRERYSYLEKNEGLFTIARLSATARQELDINSFPKKATAALKDAIDQTRSYTATEIPYTEKFLIANFANKVIELNYADAPQNNTEIYASILTYNSWVKKGRGRLFKKKRTDINKTILTFLESHKKWVALETDFLCKAESLLQEVLSAQHLAPITNMTGPWKELLAKHATAMDEHLSRYQKSSYVPLEEITQGVGDYRTRKTQDVYALVTEKFGIEELGLDDV